MGRRKRAEDAAKQKKKMAEDFEKWWESLEQRAFGPSDQRAYIVTPAFLKSLNKWLRENK